MGVSRSLTAFPSILFGRKFKVVRGRGAGREGVPCKGICRQVSEARVASG